MVTTKNIKTKRSGVKEVKHKIPEYKKSKAKLANIIKSVCKERLLNCIVGDRGKGKTEETKKVIKRYIKKYPKEKILIIDPYDEYSEYPKINIKQISDFEKPSRICLYGVSIEHRREIINNISWYYKNGLLVIEDFTALGLPLNHQYEIIGALCCCRSKDIDVIISFQSLQQIPQKIKDNTDVFRFHSIKFSKIDESYMCGNPYGSVPIYYVNFQSQYDKYVNVYYDVIYQKMIGVKSEYIMYRACAEFYEPNINQLIVKLLNGKN